MDPQEGDGVGVTWVTIQSPLEIDFSSVTVAESIGFQKLSEVEERHKVQKQAK